MGSGIELCQFLRIFVLLIGWPHFQGCMKSLLYIAPLEPFVNELGIGDLGPISWNGDVYILALVTLGPISKNGNVVNFCHKITCALFLDLSRHERTH